MKRALFGYGGHADEVMAQMGCSNDMICFVDDSYYVENSNLLPISKFNPLEYEIMICIGDSNLRKNIYDRLPKNTKYFTFIHPSAIILSDPSQIGEGSFIGANSIITTNVKIGSHSILNRGNQIGHDCVIGDFFTMMPGSIVSGNCHIGNNVLLGTNSSIKENISISNNITIGLNSGVVKSIYESGIYGGIPVKKLK